MILASLALFGTLLGQARADIMRMILTGIIFGVLCRSLTGFLQRVGRGLRLTDAGHLPSLVVDSVREELLREGARNLMGLDRRVFGWSWCNRRTLVTEPLVGEHYFNLE